ncbi:MAG: O-acetylhomoserine aminocarboxypropyltransferase/cysteine synthase [Bacteroidales bacterium]|nr:O-acetylhomoserine aminocarboxypropyltransferase/cysteine synthase [Bacteroidales bacterium]
MKDRQYRFETLQVRAGQEIDPVSKGTAVPIYQSTAYTFDDMQYGAELFELKRPGNIYTRITNTTNEVFEKRMAALEGGVAAVATASGQSAVFLSITNICGPGDNVVAQPYLYGGTFTMFAITLRDMGIEVRFAKSDRAEDIEALTDRRTKAIFLENLGNPAFNVPDYEPIIEMAGKKGICVMVDNTFGMGGYLFRPSEWGANVSIHSATKWICGHGTALGGVVVDCGNFSWTPEKYPLLARPSESYHGLVYTEVFGNAAFAGRVRVDGLRNIGPAPSPFNSFLMLQGLETLSLRAERCCANTLAVAEFLESHPAVDSVNYPGLRSNPCHSLACKYLRNGFGGVLTFRVKGGFEAAAALVGRLELILHVGSVGDAKSLIVHPASTTHSQLSEQEQIAAGVYPDMLRLSVGIENAEDIIADLQAALQQRA